jgi:uncharacterized protein (UPF0128 family)
MNKLVIAILNEKDQLEKFEEIDMSWVDQFNKEFQQQNQVNNVPFQKKIYEEEIVEMTSFAILNNMVLTENDEEFRVNREPIKTIIRRLFGYEQPESGKQENANV